MTDSDAQYGDGGTHESRLSKLKTVLGAATGIEFVAWLAVFIPSFMALATVMDTLQVPTWFVLGTGMIFSKVMSRLSRWFAERCVRRLQGVNIDAS